MSYLIVPGKYDSQALLRLINEAGGDARLRTAEGGTLAARMNGPTNIVVMDEHGNTADIAIYDVRDKNGIVHVVDRVLEPGGTARRNRVELTIRVFRQIVGQRLRCHGARIRGREYIIAIDQLAVRRGDQQHRHAFQPSGDAEASGNLLVTVEAADIHRQPFHNARP